MPSVYKAGEHIPEFGGSVDYGNTVVVHGIDELEGLDRLLKQFGDQEDPISAISHAITAPQLILPGEFAAYQPYGLDLPPEEPAETYVGQDLYNDWQLLIAATRIARALWSSDAEDIPRLCLALTVPVIGSSSRRDFTINSTNPALAIHRGSLIASLCKASFAASEFCVSLLGTVAFGAQPSGNIVKRLRSKASAGSMPLEKLSDPGAIDSNRVYTLILLHGLLSTDVGTFDGLMNRMRTPPWTNVNVVGWPHDTLLSISDNAMMLAREIKTYTHPRHPIVFACHSRGGLLARRTMTILDSKTKARIKGIATFGTPHEGARLALALPEFLGLKVSLAALGATKSVLSVFETLQHIKGFKKADGVTDLQPLGGQSEFQRKLNEAERYVSRKGRRPPILQIAGIAQSKGVGAWFSRQIIREDSDRIVEHSSSGSPLIGKVISTDCDHFGYFDESSQANKLDSAIKFLSDRLGLKRLDVPALARIKLETEDPPSRST